MIWQKNKQIIKNNHTHNHRHNEHHTFLYTRIDTKFCAQVNDINILALVIIGRHLYYVVEEPARIKGILSSCVVSF